MPSRRSLTIVAVVLTVLALLTWAVHALGVRSFSRARVDLRPPDALPRGATEGGTPWDERMRGFVAKLVPLQRKLEAESCAPFGYGRDAADLRRVLPEATPLVAPFDADLTWFAAAFAPTGPVLDELADGDCLLRGWYSVQDWSRARHAALGAALVRRAQGHPERARELLLAAWVAGAVLARGMQGDSLLFEAMIGTSAQLDAERELAWLIVETRPGALVEDVKATLRRLPRAFHEHAWSIRGELAMIRRLDANLRGSQGFLGYHALTPFYGTAASEYEPFYGRILDLLAQPPHGALAALRAHVAALPTRRLHPLVATAVPNMGSAWERNLTARTLLAVLPILPDLRAPQPEDPLTGEPVVLERVGDGFTLTMGPAPGTGSEPVVLLQVPRP